MVKIQFISTYKPRSSSNKFNKRNTFQGALFPIEQIQKDVDKYFESGESNIRCSDEHSLTLLEDGLIGKTVNSLIWRGKTRSIKYRLII